MDWEYIKKQGPLVALLLLIAWVLYHKIERLEAQVELCNQDKFHTLVSISKEYHDAMMLNTEALLRNTDFFEEFTGQKPRKKSKKSPATGRGGVGGFPEY